MSTFDRGTQWSVVKPDLWPFSNVIAQFYNRYTNYTLAKYWWNRQVPSFSLTSQKNNRNLVKLKHLLAILSQQAKFIFNPVCSAYISKVKYEKMGHMYV